MTTVAPSSTSEMVPVTSDGEALPRVKLLQGDHDYASISEKVSELCERPTGQWPFWWWPAFGVSLLMLLVGFGAATYLISTGVGVWGENNAVNWAFDITNFVFWIGIGHAGTLISAILFLFRQKWRCSINRFAEAMTLFAVMCAGVYPTIHVGRIWYVWWFAPVPNANHINQNFRSPLMWDAFAVSTYFTVSLLFWYLGLVPDLATLRDRAKKHWQRTVYGLMAFGWRGSNRHWQHYEIAYLILAGISTPLVLSVHSIVSFDFATSVLAGWHTTIFPPYFVAGAIFGGFGMVLQCMIPVRQLFGMKDIITTAHLDVMAKFVLATGTMVGYSYAMEFFTAFYSGNEYEQYAYTNRAFGPYWWAYWTMLTCNLMVPQLLWIRWMRVTPWALFVVAILVNVGMWFERFVIIVTSLHRKPLPSSWDMYFPTGVDIAQMIGDFGLFFTLTLLFIRLLPMFTLAELKTLLPGAKPHHGPEPGGPHGLGDGHIDAADHSAEGAALRPHPAAAVAAPAVGAGEPYGVVAGFANPTALLAAVRRVARAGYTKIDTNTPFPVHGINAALGRSRSRLPLLSLAGGLLGVSIGYGLTEFLSYIDYPIIVGGKGFADFEPYVPIMFELTVLFAAFATVGALFLLCGLPKYYHPLFRSDAFERATNDRFFLTIEASDPRFNRNTTPALLRRLGGTDVEVLPA